MAAVLWMDGERVSVWRVLMMEIGLTREWVCTGAGVSRTFPPEHARRSGACGGLGSRGALRRPASNHRF